MKNRARLLLPIALLLALVGYLAIRDDGSAENEKGSKDSKDAPTQGQGVAGSAKAETPQEPASLSGRVLSANATPIPGATVVLASAEDATSTVSVHDAVLRTGADGSYSYNTIPAGSYAISANAPGFLPKAAKVVLASAETRSNLELTLEPGGFALTGTVHDATGGTVAGAIVQAMPIGNSTAQQSGTLANADGSYAMNLASGHYKVWAYHTDYVPHSQLVEISAGALALDFRLAPGAVVEGQVKQLGKGAPVAGAIVSYATERKSSLTLWAGTSGAGTVVADAEGKFRIAGLSSGSLKLAARGDNSTTAEPTRIALGIAEHRSDIELFVDSAFRVSGRVVDADSGEAIADMKVFLNSAGGESVAEGTTSGEDGTFEIHSVPAGDYQIRAEGDHYMREMFGSAAAVEGDTDVGDIEVRPGAMIRGRVEPAAEADVSINLRSVSSISPDMFAFERSRADGTFEIGPFSPSKFELRASTADGRIGATEVDVPPSGLSDVVIKLAPSASLGGTVVDADGKPVAGVRVSLRQDPKGESLRVMINGLDRTAQSAITSPDGTFLIQGLGGGDYQLQVLDEQAQPLAWAKSEKLDPIDMHIEALQSRTGEVLRVEARNARITGRVLGPDGQPAADTWVSASLHRGDHQRFPAAPASPPKPSDGAEEEGKVEKRSEVSMVMISSDDEGSDGTPGLDLGRSGELPPVLTDIEGRFEITGLRRGKYDLIAEGLKGTARAIVKGAQTGEEIEIRMDALTRIEGVVTQGGEPVTRYTVELGGMGFARKQVRNDEGRFTLYRLDPGAYTVTVRGPEGEAETRVDVVAGKTAEVQISLEELVLVTGTVVDESGNPLSGLLTIPTPKRDDGNVSLSIGDDVNPTGADGKFELSVKPGSYLLMVMQMGSGPSAVVPFEATDSADVDLGTITAKPGGTGPGPRLPGTEDVDVD